MGENSPNDPGLVGGGLLGGVNSGQINNDFFECTTPVGDSSMGGSPIFNQSFGRFNKRSLDL